jgi:hypothetical protein
MLNLANYKMKKSILISLLVFIVTSSSGYSQLKNNSVAYFPQENSRPGLMNITEFNIGIGLYAINQDYAKRVFSLTSILGIGLTRNITGGIGVGVSLYNGGTLFPLFADFRYYFNLGKSRFFLFSDGGVLLNSADTEGGTKILVSPGAGLVFPVSKNLSVNLGTGLLVQFREDHGHDSFANIKLGMTYLF